MQDGIYQISRPVATVSCLAHVVGRALLAATAVFLLAPQARAASVEPCALQPPIQDLAAVLPAEVSGVGRTGSGGGVVLIVLSPRMPYALQRWPAMQEQAQAVGFNVQPLRDPRIPLAEWQAAVAALGLPELRCVPRLSLPLARTLGLLHHAPSSVVGWCGRWHAWPILGVMPNAAWRRLLQLRRKNLEEAPCA